MSGKQGGMPITNFMGCNGYKGANFQFYLSSKVVVVGGAIKCFIGEVILKLSSDEIGRAQGGMAIHNWVQIQDWKAKF